MSISNDQLFDEPFHPQWMVKKALLEKYRKQGKDMIALNNLQWKWAAQESVERISAKHGVKLKHGKP